MSSTKKIILWILGGLAALFVALVVAAFLWFRGNQDELRAARDTGMSAGRGLTAMQCVDTVLTRHAAASGFGQVMGQSLWFGGCLETAGELPALCASYTDRGVMGAARWTMSLCQARGLTGQFCSTVLQPLPQACEARAP